MALTVLITDWALHSYLDLKHSRVFSEEEYKEVLRPSAELLKEDYPGHEKFSQNKFWSAAAMDGVTLKSGFKMKWHNIGSGKVQLRLLVCIGESEAFLCEAYVKENEKVDRRYMAKFKIRLRDIAKGWYLTRGKL